MDTTYPNIKDMSPLLIVTDLERSLDFYTQTMGFEIAFRYEDFYAGITKDGHSIHFKLGKPTVEERVNRRDNEHLDLLFSVEDIDAHFQQVKNWPEIIVQPLRDMPYGREFYMVDPDGYRLGFLA